MGFEKRKVKEGEYKRLACRDCGNVLLLLDYGPPRRKGGKHRIGLYGTCFVCGSKTRVHIGHIK